MAVCGHGVSTLPSRPPRGRDEGPRRAGRWDRLRSPVGSVPWWHDRRAHADPGVPARRPRDRPARDQGAPRGRGRHRGRGRVRPGRGGHPPHPRPAAGRGDPRRSAAGRLGHRRVPRGALAGPEHQGPDPHVVRRRRGAVRRDHGRRGRLHAQAGEGQRPRRRRAPGGGRPVDARPVGDRAGARPGAQRAAGRQGAGEAHRAGAEDPRPHRRGADQPADRRAHVPRREDREELRVLDVRQARPEQPHPGRDLRDQAQAAELAARGTRR